MKALLQLEKMHGSQVVKYQRKTPKVLGTLLIAKTFVDPQCESFMDIDPMDVECPLMSRAGLESNKGKCLAINVRLFKEHDRCHH